MFYTNNNLGLSILNAPVKEEHIKKLNKEIGSDWFSVKEDDIEKHNMHSEYYFMNEYTAKRLNLAKKEGRRIISVGTTTIALNVGYLVNIRLKQLIATLVFPYSFVIIRVIILISINFFIAQRTFSSVLDVGHSWTYYILLQLRIKSSIKEILNLSNILIVCLEYSFLKYLVITSCFSFSKRSPNTTKPPLGSHSNFILCIIVSMSTRYDGIDSLLSILISGLASQLSPILPDLMTPII